ncbi:TonB-dependent receptor plug domain-containing protein [Emticicia sp. TH156]|uniref:TonB-dependent receptor plug domain-containing protein n=1 Tax=Emticicia sp. TH156 TaxID=2067454 RepID=UPI000C78E3E7|nr:TonB-dependent receptor plug domain-containing protein [Emticicia sp. TH156]PLK43311.1 TonB-dependent receptor [Emticicia sp. TH156]
MKRTILFFAVSTILFSFVVNDELTDTIVSKFNQYASLYPQEKVYLHLDKPYYTAGETVWLKAYTVDASTNQFSQKSVPLYVELIDNLFGKVLERKILKLEDGTAAGDFELADSLHSGYYRLRAYTNWMRNFDEDLMFVKDFKVHKVGQEVTPVKYDSREIDFRFFPEGGQIVEGINNRVAFKATDVTGNGVDVNGVVFTQAGDTVMRFESQHLGMGEFGFKAEPGETYLAKIRYRNIMEKKVAFPPIEKNGYVLGVEAVADNNLMRLYAGHNYNKPRESGQMVIIGQSQGVICYIARTPVSNKSVALKVPKDKFPEGVAQFTVFDETGRPRCERLVYVFHEDDVNVSIMPDKSAYSPKEEVKLNIKATSADGSPVKGNFSVVVSDSRQVLLQPNEENIMNYLLLSSEVRGKVEQPDYYFEQNKPEVRRHLDVLLMTQGWRRFRWDDILKPSIPEPRFLHEQGLSITGEVTRPNGKLFEKPLTLTYMMWLDNDKRHFGVGEAATNGSFLISDLDYSGQAKILVQAVAGKLNRNTRIFINKMVSPKVQVVAIPFNPITFDESDLADYLKRTREALEIARILKNQRERLLQEVVVKAKKHIEREDRVLYSHASNTLKITPDMNSYANVLDLLRGRVPGVQVSGSPMNPSVTIRGLSSITGSSEPAFLLDGMMVDKQMILSIPVFDVDRVDVLKGADATIYGSRGGNGVISVLTKRGGSDPVGPTTGIEVAEVNGYAIPKEFYAPRYNEASPEDFQSNPRPDYRSTIFWAPVVKTDENGQAKLSFFNTDASAQVSIRLEGLSYDGVPIRAKAGYLVKK